MPNAPKSCAGKLPENAVPQSRIGFQYVEALLLIEDGKAEEALQTLLQMDSSQALVRYDVHERRSYWAMQPPRGMS